MYVQAQSIWFGTAALRGAMAAASRGILICLSAEMFRSPSVEEAC